ncbi:hypothetical protein VMCG_08701 [Cytospora schulzeri]|uniref:Cyanovirin-N domain-containing protein n=1 Tax=Cytospora schulzeri TaxID=448051 RepID=A0A423VQ87_9PEZI|nr:hypothetical protein VMCG_08701 [Valsa malicola]
MRGPALLVTPLAAHLALAALSQDGLDLLYACEGLDIDPNTGVLSGKCQAGEDPALTSVDLNKCLRWGALIDPGSFYNTKLVSPVNGLTPTENGNFTRSCGPCYIIKRDEKGQAAAQLMCSCSAEGSFTKTEYTLDLTDILSVTNKGCLECMGTSGDCAPEVPLDPSKGLYNGDLDSDGFNNREELLDWLQLRVETERTPCEQHIARHPRFLPETWANTTHHRCKADYGLCYYQTPGLGCLSTFEAFQLIEGSKYWYRMHYSFNYYTMKIERLNRVFQLCKFPGQCKDETTNDSNFENCTKPNPLARYEDIIYDSGADSLLSQLYATTLLDSTVEMSRPTSAHPEKATTLQIKTKARDKK